jgi:hypothetical protein
VDLGPCECPNTPHPEGDKAWLRPRLTAEGGLLAQAIVATATDPRETYAALGFALLSDGLVRWTLQDDDGKPVPTDTTLLRSGALDWDTTLSPIAEKANDLYMESVMAPLVRGRLTPLPHGQTEVSTSPTTDSSTESPTPSEPSTTPITPPSHPTGSHTDTDSST